jgi:hypothetical protein
VCCYTVRSGTHRSFHGSCYKGTMTGTLSPDQTGRIPALFCLSERTSFDGSFTKPLYTAGCLRRRFGSGISVFTLLQSRTLSFQFCDIHRSIKVKQTLHKPSAFREVEAPRISRQSAYEDGKVVGFTHGPALPPGNIPSSYLC